VGEDKYAEDGVDVAEGDDFSKIAGEICRGTFGNSNHVEVVDFSNGYFRGPRGFRFKNLPESTFMDVAPTGLVPKLSLLTLR
jgi:hypothetical protein